MFVCGDRDFIELRNHPKFLFWLPFFCFGVLKPKGLHGQWNAVTIAVSCEIFKNFWRGITVFTNFRHGITVFTNFGRDITVFEGTLRPPHFLMCDSSKYPYPLNH